MAPWSVNNVQSRRRGENATQRVGVHILIEAIQQLIVTFSLGQGMPLEYYTTMRDCATDRAPAKCMKLTNKARYRS